MNLLDLSLRKVANRIHREFKFGINPEIKQPKWYEIQAGLAKGHKIFVARDLFHGWTEMIQGQYDNFLYQVAEEFASKHLEERPVIFDIGAHFGYSSLCFSGISNQSGKAVVLAFEPNPHNLKALEKHIEHNQIENIEIIPLALSDSQGSFEMMISSDIQGSQSTGSFLDGVTPPLEMNVYKNFQKATVKTDTLDRLIQEKTLSPNILKIDVEGAEYQVLNGALGWLKNKDQKKLLLIEVHNILAMHDCLSLIMNHGFTSQVLDREDASVSRCFIKATNF